MVETKESLDSEPNEIQKKDIFDIKLKNLIEFECKKYRSKGYGLIVACILALIYFFGFPQLLFKIWPEKVVNEGIFYGLTIYLTFNAVLVLTNLEYMLYYKLEHPFLERYKTTPDAWPWISNKEKWNKQLKKTFLKVFINNFVLLPLFFIPDFISNSSPLRLDRESFPTYTEIVIQMATCMLIEDFIFYCMHSLLHTKYFYSKIHKVHHEYVESVAISATYSHFLEYILGNILPSSVAPLLLGKRMHFITYLVYVVMVLHESHDGHSGYTFSWSPHRVIPLTFDAEFHIFHHWKYHGNYSNYLSIWDRVFGTVNKFYKEYYIEKEKYIARYKTKQAINSESEIENEKEKKE